MPVSRRLRRQPRRTPASVFRYTVDASVFVNAFNPHEAGHAASLAILAAIHETGDPIIVPTLVMPEIASAVARASDDTDAAQQYAIATAALAHLTLVSLTPGAAREAAELAAGHRLRGADAVYASVARRYGTTLLSRDREQRSRAAAVVECQTPEEALRSRQPSRGVQGRRSRT